MESLTHGGERPALRGRVKISGLAGGSSVWHTEVEVISSRRVMARESQAFQREPLVSSEHEVVALVAHELRHPLTAIEAALPLLIEAPQLETRQKARRVLERQVEYMRRLVDDLFDAERARRGVLQLQTRAVDFR
jgi:signal transduction histidine kinase